MVTNDQPLYRYSLDENDVIVSVDDWWLAFAKENNAAELQKSKVLGQTLWGFIADVPTRMLYMEIHSHVRRTGSPITVPFRCDSPTLKRFMQLTISKSMIDQLLYESKLIRAVPQRRLPALDPLQQRSNQYLTMCSFCKRSLIDESTWVEIQNIALKLRMYENQSAPGLIYTVCPTCETQLQSTQQQPQQASP